jgi:predicted HTH transcriptional regulator
MALNRDQLRAITDASDFERLIGEIENEWFDCKSQPYQIERDSAKRELAKDVSSFANARGGYIFIGVRTKTRPLRSGDEVEIIRSFAQSLVNTNQYHDIINNWVYPEIENVKVEWKSSKNDSSQGIVIITIPQQ